MWLKHNFNLNVLKKKMSFKQIKCNLDGAKGIKVIKNKTISDRCISKYAGIRMGIIWTF